MLSTLGIDLTWIFIISFIVMNKWSELQGDGVLNNIIGGFSHKIQDLSSNVDIRDVWGPGHGVSFSTNNDQLSTLL